MISLSGLPVMSAFASPSDPADPGFCTGFPVSSGFTLSPAFFVERLRGAFGLIARTSRSRIALGLICLRCVGVDDLASSSRFKISEARWNTLARSAADALRV